jgi:hypothetical protein
VAPPAQALLALQSTLQVADSQVMGPRQAPTPQRVVHVDPPRQDTPASHAPFPVQASVQAWASHATGPGQLPAPVHRTWHVSPPHATGPTTEGDAAA